MILNTDRIKRIANKVRELPDAVLADIGFERVMGLEVVADPRTTRSTTSCDRTYDVIVDIVVDIVSEVEYPTMSGERPAEQPKTWPNCRNRTTEQYLLLASHSEVTPMHLTAVKSDLSRLLQIACSFPEKQAPMPILKHSLLSAGSGVLQLQASDLKQSVSALCPASVLASGSIAVNSKLLSDSIGALPEGAVDLRVDDMLLIVSSGRRKYKLPFELADNFPRMPEIDRSHPALEIAASELVGLIDRCRRASSDDDSDPKSSSMLLEIGNGTAMAVSLDGKMLCVAKHVYGGTNGLTAMIPMKGMRRLEKALGEYSGVVKISRSTRSDSGIASLFFEFGSIRFWSSVFDRASFHTYEVFLDNVANHRRVLVPRQALAESTAAVAEIFDKDDHPKVTVSIRDGSIRLFARSTAKGSAEDFIEGIQYSGDPYHVGMNAQNIADALVPVGTKEVQLGWLPGSSLVSLTIPDSDSYCALLGTFAVDEADVVK